MLLRVQFSWSRDPTRDILLWPGHTVTITARPVVVDHQGGRPHVATCRDAQLPGLQVQFNSFP
jgi:hypothetical protein